MNAAVEHHSFESAIASALSDSNVSFLLKTEQRTTLGDVFPPAAVCIHHLLHRSDWFLVYPRHPLVTPLWKWFYLWRFSRP